MSKQRKSVSLSEDNHQFLTDHDNASALVDRLVTQYRTGGQDESVIKQYRVRQVASEITALEKQMELKQQELEGLQDDVETAEQMEQVKLSEARNALSKTPKEPDNPAIQNWADELGMTPQELINELG